MLSTIPEKKILENRDILAAFFSFKQGVVNEKTGVHREISIFPSSSPPLAPRVFFLVYDKIIFLRIPSVYSPFLLFN